MLKGDIITLLPQEANNSNLDAYFTAAHARWMAGYDIGAVLAILREMVGLRVGSEERDRASRESYAEPQN